MDHVLDELLRDYDKAEKDCRQAQNVLREKKHDLTMEVIHKGMIECVTINVQKLRVALHRGY
ncbi:hypothetical protein CMI37_27215 [Candidatus Pacearchaeota archaeon]|nr:hypothetical protein [Candidatus Pacearchaeota archaeon]|tara:strand:+ start:3351 stop:3536 length:186 start_codon:yes stop_codon:yes gene_type:complete